MAEGEARAYRKFAEWERRRKEAEGRGEEFTEPCLQNHLIFHKRIQKNNTLYNQQ